MSHLIEIIEKKQKGEKLRYKKLKMENKQINF